MRNPGAFSVAGSVPSQSRQPLLQAPRRASVPAPMPHDFSFYDFIQNSINIFNANAIIISAQLSIIHVASIYQSIQCIQS
jgi:hypothetical protein